MKSSVQHKPLNFRKQSQDGDDKKDVERKLKLKFSVHGHRVVFNLVLIDINSWCELLILYNSFPPTTQLQIIFLHMYKYYNFRD